MKTFIKPSQNTRNLDILKISLFEWAIARLTQSTAVWPGEGAYLFWNMRKQ